MSVISAVGSNSRRQRSPTTGSLRPTPLVDTISKEAQDHSTGTDQSDDRTILALRIKA
jgi:serine phosphatase RsbU (regulator of sigma subunit)